jgi:hypothetical protein
MRFLDVQDATVARVALDGSGAQTLVAVDGKASAKINVDQALEGSATIQTIDFGASANRRAIDAR